MSSKVNFAKRGECKRCDTAVQEQWRCKLEGGGIGLDRWEAEVQQHQDYLDKMARVPREETSKPEEVGASRIHLQLGEMWRTLLFPASVQGACGEAQG